MSDTITFQFEELPLLIDLGAHAGLVDGEAEISFETDGEFSIAAISIDGYRDGKPMQVPVCRESHQWLWLQIHDQLENGNFKKEIEGQIERALEGERDDDRSMRRELERVS